MDIYRYFRENFDGHSNTNAYLLALASLFVYHDKAPGPVEGSFVTRIRWLFKHLSDSDPLDVEIFSGNHTLPYDTECAVLTNSKIIIVAFRGTEGITGVQDWATSADHLMRDAPSSWGNVKVHRGFYNALKEVYQDVRTYVREQIQQNGNRKVFLTGHSLGGALATVCAYRFQQVGSVYVHGVYTFGAPRVGDKDFKKLYDSVLLSRTYRWVNDDDFAAKMPDFAGAPSPITNVTTYYHVGQLNHIHANGTVDMNHPDFEPVLTLSDSDHNMIGYCEHIWNQLADKERTSAASPNYLLKRDVPLTVVL